MCRSRVAALTLLLLLLVGACGGGDDSGSGSDSGTEQSSDATASVDVSKQPAAPFNEDALPASAIAAFQADLDASPHGPVYKTWTNDARFIDEAKLSYARLICQPDGLTFDAVVSEATDILKMVKPTITEEDVAAMDYLGRAARRHLCP